MQLREADKHYEKPKEIKYDDLTLKKKLEHIWEYYKWHITAVIGGIILVVYIAYIILVPSPTYSVDVLMVGKLAYEEEQIKSINEKFHTDFDANLQLDFVDFSSTSQYTMNIYNKIYALATSKQLDILILPKEVYTQLAQQEIKMLIPLEEVSSLDEVLESHKEDLCKALNKKDNQMHVYGIKIDQAILKEKLCIATDEEYIMAVVESVKNIDQTVNVMNYLLE